MSLELVNANVVVVARRFNPSIARDHWLIKNGILNEDEILPGCVFTDVLAQVRSKFFDLLMVPEQIQFSPHGDVPSDEQLVAERVWKIVSTLPHTPYSALGLNFHWHVRPEVLSIKDLCRQLFFSSTSAVHRELDTEDTKFGGYVSRDFSGFRMKLDIRPMLIVESQTEFLQLGFNFHKDLPKEMDQEDRNTAIKEGLAKWKEFSGEAEKISHVIAEADSR